MSNTAKILEPRWERRKDARPGELVAAALDLFIEKGFADADRIAIYGGSYGGYACLAGLTFTPDL